MKCLVALMLMALSVCALQTENKAVHYDSINETDDSHIDVILLILGQIQNDISKLDTKTTNLQSAVGSLSMKVRNVENDFADLSTKQQSDYKTINDHMAVLDITVEDLSTKQQSDHNTIDGNVAELESTVEDNYQELRADIDAISGGAVLQPNNQSITVQCIDSGKDFYYEWIDTKYTWLEARNNCLSNGGDLAYHSLEPMTFRQEVLCGYFDLCMNGKGQGGPNGDSSEWPWWGLHRNKTAISECSSNAYYYWEYLDGTCAESYTGSGINWFHYAEEDQEGEDCAGLMGLEFNDPYFLKAYSFPCDSENSRRPSICEYKCVY